MSEMPTISASPPAGGDAASLPPADLLKGVRVLDLTHVLSGPFCTYQMALLGAEVIKIEPPGQGDLARQLGADPDLNHDLMGASFLAQNAGKKSVTLDLKKPEGRRLFAALVEKADVLVENFRPGVMDRLGFGWETLRALNPSLVYCAISGFGREGPLRRKSAYDQIVQGMSGVMSITGDATTAPLRVGFPVCDTIGGLTAAFAIVAALHAARATGQGRLVDVSMLDSTITTLGWVVSNYLTAGVVPEPLGNENMTAAPSGTFRTGRGLLNIAANQQAQYETLASILGRPDLIVDARFADRESRKLNRQVLNLEIEAALASRAAAEWEEDLGAAGVPVGRVLDVPEVLAHPQIRERRLVQELEDAAFPGRSTRVTRAGYRLSDCEPAARSAPPRLGEHTEEVLTSLGLDRNDVADLRERGIV